MFKIAVYGKGGVGKSTISSNLSFLLSKDGSRVLHVGCDPKHDSTRLLMHGESICTFSQDTDKDPVHIGINGISCVECGGADPGKGCAGKGLELLFSKISDIDADYRVCDVLGDVVCGGFSIPARKGNSDAILIVTSGEFMSLYAANNILRGLKNINPSSSILGLVFNSRGDPAEEISVKRFSEAICIPIICRIPRSELFFKAEQAGETLCSLYPESDEARILSHLAEFVKEHAEMYDPRPLSEESMMDLAAGRPIRQIQEEKKRVKCNFEGFDSERNLTYLGDFVMPACTSHGAADGAMKIRDAAVILHGPKNCAYLMEYAFRRRVLYSSSERSSEIPEPGLYSTGLDAEEAFRDSGRNIDDTILRAKRDGYKYMFLVATCASEIIGVDLQRIAKEMSGKYSVQVIYVQPDSTFLGSKFGGTFGLFDALIGRMGPREIEKDTVNLIGRWFYGAGKDQEQEALQYILSTLGLRIRFCFLDSSYMSEIEDFCKAEYDFQLGLSKFNNRVAERIHEVTGRRMPLELDVPVGLNESIEWVRRIVGYIPELENRLESAERILNERFQSIVERYSPALRNKRVVLYCLLVRDLKWQVDTLRALGMEVVSIMFVKGAFIDHNVRIPDYGDIKVLNDMNMCDLLNLTSKEHIDLVITNDADRVTRHGFKWAPLGSRHYGLEGVEEWCRILSDSMRVKNPTWEREL